MVVLSGRSWAIGHHTTVLIAIQGYSFKGHPPHEALDSRVNKPVGAAWSSNPRFTTDLLPTIAAKAALQTAWPGVSGAESLRGAMAGLEKSREDLGVAYVLYL